MTTPRYHVSKNRLEGSLCDTSLGQLLDSCRKHLVTGEIRIVGAGGQPRRGHVRVRAGAVDEAQWGELRGDLAVVEMRGLTDGLYELGQRLPDLGGELGEAAACAGELKDVPLAAIMRHCEEQALSCTIAISGVEGSGEISYRAGEIVGWSMNGDSSEDAIVAVTQVRDGHFRVDSPPLALDIGGWPSVSRDPTQPFKIEHLAAMRPKPAKPSAPVVAPPPVPIGGATGALRAAAPAAATPATPPPLPGLGVASGAARDEGPVIIEAADRAPATAISAPPAGSDAHSGTDRTPALLSRAARGTGAAAVPHAGGGAAASTVPKLADAELPSAAAALELPDAALPNAAAEVGDPAGPPMPPPGGAAPIEQSLPRESDRGEGRAAASPGWAVPPLPALAEPMRPPPRLSTESSRGRDWRVFAAVSIALVVFAALLWWVLGVL